MQPALADWWSWCKGGEGCLAGDRVCTDHQARIDKRGTGLNLAGMDANAKVLIIWHSRTGAARAMARAAAQGAGEAGRLLRAEEANPDDLLAAAAYIFAGPENLASLSGAMKEMFDRCYYPLLGQIEGRAYATMISAGSDGTGAERQLDRIVTGWRLRRVADSLIVNCDAQTPEAILAPKTVAMANLVRCQELGAAMAEGVTLGIF